MRFPEWLKATRQRVDPGTVTMTLELDLSRYGSALRELGRAMSVGTGVPMTALLGFGDAMTAAAAAERASVAMLKLQDAMTADMVAMVRREVAREEARRAGLEARYYVRGAMDPRFTAPVARDNYVNDMLAGRDGSPWDPEGRALRAAAFLRGWVEHHPEPVCECWPTPVHMHYVYYGITEPGSAWEWNPDCPVHPPDPEPVPVYGGWNPVAATVACDWCGECEWCRTYPTGQ